jgi:hypothetical protein
MRCRRVRHCGTDFKRVWRAGDVCSASDRAFARDRYPECDFRGGRDEGCVDYDYGVCEAGAGFRDVIVDGGERDRKWDSGVYRHRARRHSE